jgi:alkylglycerol monooxygenase
VNLNPIGVAVPFFFLLIGVEWLVARSRKRDVFRVNDSMADLTCGMGDQLIGLGFKGVSFAIYAAVHQAVGMFSFEVASPWTWVIGMLGVDLGYYAYHRFSHRVNWAWATHAVHHQSEEYNLAVALRQPWFTQFYSWAFYIPLAVLGLPPIVWVTSFSINLLYQFWIHTRLIGKLGAFELVFNTPSHHRVHHGTNPKYIDKNYAGILIIWDRLFGTFVPEAEEPLYGTLKPLRSWNPLWANVGPWVMIAKAADEMPGFFDKLRVWWMPPGWTPAGIVTPPFPAPDRGYDADGPAGLHVYAVGHLLPIIGLMGLVLTFEQSLPVLGMVGIALGIIWTAMGWAGLFERRSWSISVELSRLVALGGGAVALAVWRGDLYWLLAAGVVLFALWSAHWVWRSRVALSAAA